MLTLILGLLRPDSGTIHVNGQRIDDVRERDPPVLRDDAQARFIVLHDCQIRFEGTGDELLASQDDYLRESLFKR